MLEGVGLKLTVCQCTVRHDVVGELDDIDVQSLGGGDLLDLFHDLRVLGRCNTNLDGFGQRLTGGKESGERSREDDFLHGCLLGFVVLGFVVLDRFYQFLRVRLSKLRASRSPALCTSCTSTISTSTTTSITSGMKRW